MPVTAEQRRVVVVSDTALRTQPPGGSTTTAATAARTRTRNRKSGYIDLITNTRFRPTLLAKI